MRELVLLAVIILFAACAAPGESSGTNGVKDAAGLKSKERVTIVEMQNVSPTVYNSQIHSVSTDDELSALPSGHYRTFLRAGDVIDVTIFETEEDGLFSSSDSKILNLGQFTVDQKGAVSLPFAGRKMASGLTAEELQMKIVAGLRGSTINPQAVVRVVERPANIITVSGSVRNPGQVAMTSGIERVVDILARVGGASSQSDEVTVIRGDRRASISLERLLNDSKQNISLQPGDQIRVENSSSNFIALGAFKKRGEFPLDANGLTLAQAVARLGGLPDDSADAPNLYIFRADALTGRADEPQSNHQTRHPVIYHVNLKEVSSFIIMQQFYLRSGDMLFVSKLPLKNGAKLEGNPPAN